MTYVRHLKSGTVSYYVVMASFVGNLQAEVLLSDFNASRRIQLRQLGVTFSFQAPDDLRISSGKPIRGELFYWRYGTKTAINIVKRAQMAFNDRIRLFTCFVNMF